MRPRLTDYTVLSFDCYGTLVDWETGIARALEPWRVRHRVTTDREALLEAYARIEARHEAETPERRYSDILAAVHADLARELGVASSTEEARRFAQSIGEWPPFPDTVEALRYLGEHYLLVILSNVDRDSFRATEKRLGVRFHRVFTAEEIGSYKPDLKNFEHMLRELALEGFASENVLHTAQSLFHDHVPASKLGLATNWIDRRHARTGHGATLPPAEAVTPTFRHVSLADFVGHHRREVAARSTSS